MKRQVTTIAILAALTSGCGADTPASTAPVAPTPVATAPPAAKPTRESLPTATMSPAETVAPTARARIVPAASATRFAPDGIRATGDAREFDRRLKAAMRSLEQLPGYTYTASHSPFLEGLTLTGTVAGTGSRDWTLSEVGSPEHIVARWVFIHPAIYTDVSGAWEETGELPFDPRAALSMPGPGTGSMFQQYGPMTNLRSKQVTIEGRPATRYDIDLDLEALMQGQKLPEGQPGKLTYSMWIAGDGGYLLRYTGAMPFTAPSPPETIDVTPLDIAPDFEIPTVGQAVFTGNPPPWRAAVIGQIGLSGLESYAFEQSTDVGDVTFTASGSVSASRGQLTGTQPDYAPRPGKVATPGVANLPIVRTELIYIGNKLWSRRGDGAWRTVKLRSPGRTGPVEISEHDAEAFMLLDSIPGGSPAGLRILHPAADAAPEGAGVDPISAMPALQGGRLVGTEKVNGVEALHYSGRVGMGGAGSTAEYWLAADGHHMLRARVRMKSGPMVPGMDGSIRIDLDVTDVNRPFALKPPR